jgi:hypothetical protein
MDMDGLCALVESAKFPTQQSSSVSDNASVYYIHTWCSLWALRDKWKRKKGTGQVLIGQEIFSLSGVPNLDLAAMAWMRASLTWAFIFFLLFSYADRRMTPTYVYPSFLSVFVHPCQHSCHWSFRNVVFLFLGNIITSTSIVVLKRRLKMIRIDMIA